MRGSRAVASHPSGQTHPRGTHHRRAGWNTPVQTVGRPSLPTLQAESKRSMTPLKAFIVEDSPVIRENLVAALEEMAPISVVATADDEASAVRWLDENACDLA